MHAPTRSAAVASPSVKSSRWLIPAVIALGLLAGAAIVGRPTSIEGDVPLPLDAGNTTTTVTTAAPTTTAAAPSTTSGDSTDTTAALVNTTTTSTTTTVPAPDPASVRVVVGNGSARNGLATTTADELTAAGYVDVVATNAISKSADTYIVYRDGFQAAAAAVAELLEIPGERVLPYIDAEVTERDEQGDVIVVVGADRAG
jgi:hypothetical protein